MIIVFLAPIFLASNEDMTFVSSSLVNAQNISIFDIFSLFKSTSSVAEPFKTMVFSSFLDKSPHFSIFESISLTLYDFSSSFANDEPTFPPPTIIILE